MERGQMEAGLHEISLAVKMTEVISEIDRVSRHLPSVIIIHNLLTGGIDYMSERGLKILKITMNELQDMGNTYYETFFNPVDAENYTPKYLEWLSRNEPEEVFCFFQQVRGKGDKEFGWYLSASKVLMQDDDGKPCLAITAAHPADELTSITYKIERLLEEREMMRKCFNKYIQLTKREKEIIKLLASGESATKIAGKLFISTTTVEQHRKNIKKKLGINNIAELVRFAQAFDMI